jgi:hypothetical protein
MLTQTKLKEILHYDPITGKFTRYGNYSKCGSKSYQGYILIGIGSKTYYAHRLAWLYVTGEWPSKEIDHKNRIRDDNRWENLREADRSLQNRNRNDRGWSIPNISYQANGWTVRIGRKKYVGRFKCLGKAIYARARAIKDLNA